MRVLHVGKYLVPVPGGMESSVYELCQGLLHKKALDVRCLVANTSMRTLHEMMTGLPVTRVARWGTVASTPVAPGFKHEALRKKVDLLHFHLPNPLATISFAALKLPYVVTYHCDILRYPTLLKLYLPTLKRFLKGAQKIIVTSGDLLASSPVLAAFKDKCVVIPLAMDTSYLEINEHRRQKMIEIGNAHGENLILFVGRLVPYKGLHHLIDAMDAVQGKLLIIGAGPEKEKLVELVRGKKLSDKVSFEGYVAREDLGAYYQAASAVALTSIDEREAFGMTLLEGIACAKPLLTTDLKTGVSLVNRNGYNGIHVPVGDVDAIGRGLNLLLGDLVLRTQLGKNGLAHFQKNFSLDATLEAHVQLYRGVLAGAEAS